MKRRFVAALIVALAALFSQGGGLVLAAVCPHLRAEQPDNSCHANSQGTKPQEVAKHHQSAEVARPAFDTLEHGVRCNHCVVHSRSKREESALQQTATSQRADDQKWAVPVSKVEPPSCLRSIAWSAKPQGPPGPTAPLHILLSVFRI
jgi:hypothetical protein